MESSTSDTWTALRVSLVVLGVVAALWLAYQLGTLIILFVFSVLFAYLVAPLVAFVQRRLTVGGGRRPLPRGAAIGLAYLAMFGVVALLVAWAVPRVAAAVKAASAGLPGVANGQSLALVYDWLGRLGVSPSMIERAVSAANSTIGMAASRIAAAFVHVSAYVPWLALIPIVSFFLLKDAQELTQASIRMLPARWRVHAPALLSRIDRALAAYIRAQLVACLIVGTIVGVGFAVLRVPFAPVLAVGAGLAEFVPLVGPLVVAVVSAATAAFRSPMSALWVLLFLGVLRVVEDYVIYPRLVGSRIHLHPLAVILAVLAGGELGGVVGVLLSVPTLAIWSAVYRYLMESSGPGHADRRPPA
jgi:predicted PurR-regulated permease PerM